MSSCAISALAWLPWNFQSSKRRWYSPNVPVVRAAWRSRAAIIAIMSPTNDSAGPRFLPPQIALTMGTMASVPMSASGIRCSAPPSAFVAPATSSWTAAMMSSAMDAFSSPLIFSRPR